MRGRGTMGNRAGMRRINLIEQEEDQLEVSNEYKEDKLVLHVGGGGNEPFMMKGKINNESFKTMIDSGSPITIFTQTDLRRILKHDVIFARPLPNTEQYVEYNNKPMNLLEFTTVIVQVGKLKLKNARRVITRDCKRSLINWLIQLQSRRGQRE